ncbi:hypothetical protein BOX15_Mlig004696g2, partial [Macrostomum lignano]
PGCFACWFAVLSSIHANLFIFWLCQATERAENVEREAAKRQKELEKVEEKLIEEKQRTSALKQEMDAMLTEFQQL